MAVAAYVLRRARAFERALGRAASRATLALAAWALPAADAAAEQRVALVIGNSAYAHAARLTNPPNDARDVAAALGRVGFDRVTVKRDRSLSELRGDLQSFARQARGADVALVFFAGHGVSVANRSWLVPIDARLARTDDVAFEAIPLELALQSVEGARKLKLVVLDACRNNPFAARMASVPGGARSLSRGLAKVEPPADSLVWYAARDGSEALDGDGRNSPFTTALLSRIEQPGVELDKLFRQVRDDVIRATDGAQEPFRYGSRGAEDFYFRAPAAAPAESAAALPPLPAPAPAARPAASAPDRGPDLASALGLGDSAPPTPERADPTGRPVRIDMAVEFDRGGGMRCAVQTRLQAGRLVLIRRPFQCGAATVTLTLETDADGDLVRDGRFDLDFQDVPLRGDDWRYIGRSKYLPRVEVKVAPQ